MRRFAGILIALLGGVSLLLVLTGLLHDPDPGPLRLSRRTVEVDGTRMSFHQRGSGPDVVLLHGGMGSAEDFAPVLERLGDGFRVTAVDRPGFGLSRARGDDPTYPGNARLVSGVIRALRLERPVVVGHSHGGGVALRLAETDPDLPAGLVLLAAAAYPAGEAKLTDRLGAIPVFGEGVNAWLGPWIGPPTIAGTLGAMIGPDGSRLPPDFVAYRQELWINPRSLSAKARQAVSDADGLRAIAASLGSVRARAIVIGCDEDPVEGHGVDSRRLASELPRSELRWLDACGHYVQFARPAEVAAAIGELAAAR